MENLKNLPPVERLRLHLIKDAQKARRGSLRPWPKIPIRELVPGMQTLFSYFRNLDSDDPKYRAIAEEFLGRRVEIYGFASVDELRDSLIQLQQEFRAKMPEDEWNKYFGDTADFN